MSLPSLSIVIPSFNQGRFIERTLLSILHQRYDGPLEIVVSDGGSTDETVSVLRRYPEVKWWSERDGGIADATNKGLAAASGEILAIQSSDDFYFRHALADSVDTLLLDDSLAIVAGCDVYLQPDEASFTCSPLDNHEITPRSLLMRRVIPQHCAFFHREILDRVGGLRLSMTEGAEVDLWYRALHFFKARFFPLHTAAYQLHAMQRTKRGDCWYDSLVGMVEGCEADKNYSRQFRMTTADKRDLYARWEILQEQRAGNVASTIELIERLMESPECTDETLRFLELHDLIPRRPRMNSDPRHQNHRVPDFNWYQNFGEAMRAVA